MIHNKSSKYLPNEWKVLPFTEVFRDKTAGQKKIKKSEYKSKGLIPVIDQGASKIAGYTNDESAKCDAKHPCILFGDHTRIFKLVDHTFAIGADGVKILACSSDILISYAFFFLRQLRLPNEGYSRHYKFLKETNVILPPLPEQKRIAAILNKADAIRRKRQETLKLTEELIHSIFLDMFGDPVCNPKNWESGKLKKYSMVQTGATPPSKKENMFGGSVPFITPGDLGSQNASRRTLTEEGVKHSRTVGKNSTLVCCIGATIGKMDITNTVSAFNQQINSIEWSNEINPFFGYTMVKFLKNIIINSAKSTTLPILKKSLFEELTVIKPDEVLQKQFSEIFLTIIKLYEQRSEFLSESNKLFNSLQQRAFSGELSNN